MRDIRHVFSALCQASVFAMLVTAGQGHAQSDGTVAADDPLLLLKLNQCQADHAICEGQRADLQKLYNDLESASQTEGISEEEFEKVRSDLLVCENQTAEIESQLKTCQSAKPEEEVPEDPLVLPLCVECTDQIAENERLKEELDDKTAEYEGLLKDLEDATKRAKDLEEELDRTREGQDDQSHLLEEEISKRKASEAEVAELKAEIERLNKLLEDLRDAQRDLEVAMQENSDLMKEVDRYKRRLAELGVSLEPGFEYLAKDVADSYLSLDELSDLPAGTRRLASAKCSDAIAWLNGAGKGSSRVDPPFSFSAWIWSGSEWEICARNFDGTETIRKPSAGEASHVLIFE